MPPIRIITGDEIPESFFSPQRAEAPEETVREILHKVRTEGDAALHAFSQAFDGFDPPVLETGADVLEECRAEMEKENPQLYHALCLSRDLGMDFARKQKACFTDFETELSPGLFAGQKNIPVDRAGLYVPAGRFPLLSSVIMCACPAKAAGVPEVILCTPPVKNGNARIPAHKGILAAAAICGVDRVFAAGGAQAIAAMAYGTESIPKVCVIAGPGNKYVTAAKKAVFGNAGIDIPAGPSEVLVISDGSGNPDWTAADLLAQSEHDTVAQAVLLTTDAAFARAVAESMQRMMQDTLPPDSAAHRSVPNNGFLITVPDLETAAEIANRKAPEHLELAMNPGPARDKLAASLRNYGSLFTGHRSAEVLGDYAAGLNHTLPTAGAAAFTGGLSVRHFLKTVTTLRAGETPDADLSGWEASARAAETLAEAEGLTGHRTAAALRLRSR